MPKATTAAPGQRELAIAVYPRSQPRIDPAAFEDAVDLALHAGVQSINFSYKWSALEPGTQSYALDPLKNDFRLADQRNLDVLLTLQVINTTTREVPADLRDAAFDSTRMKGRFHHLVDTLKPLLGGHLRFLSIGNEVDAYLNAHPDQWSSYQAFYEDGLAYAHTTLPGVEIGVTTEFAAASGASADRVARLNRRSDVVVLTYYPLAPDFKTQPASSPLSDLPKMVALAADKPVVLQEVGYPSASQLASSEQAQARFVHDVFVAWDQVGAAIPFLDFFLLHDFATSLCDQLAGYYGLPGNSNFKAYLCTLGLRHRDGTPKPAWAQFEAGATQLRTTAPRP